MPDQQELQPQTERSQPELPPQPPLPEKKPKKRRRQIFLITGAVLLVVVLAGAAYLAGTLMNQNPTGQGGLFGQIFTQGGGAVQVQDISHPEITPALEIPAIQADIRGIFVSRSGDSFTIGTGSFGLTVSGSGAPQPHYDGPTYEVVVTQKTSIYKDTTKMDPDYSGPIQQTVAAGSLDDLNTLTEISVWGKKTGNRYIADVIVYTQPQTGVNGGSGGTLK